jgi:hypothetical protein
MPMQRERRDWTEWHRAYDDPSSRLSRRLRLVQQHLRAAVDVHAGPLRIVAMCAGEARDVAGALAGHPRRGEVRGRLVELDARLAEIARAAVRDAGLNQVDVACADAALTDSYEGAVPADIVMACGVFGNTTDDDIRHTVEWLPALCAPGATVIWTRGLRADRDVALDIRTWFEEEGFEEVAYESPPGETFRVGVHRLVAPPRPFVAGVRLFRFIR